MNELFIKLVNDIIPAGLIILAVIIIRLILYKAPKWIICVMWGMAAIRLLSPILPETDFAIIPYKVSNTISFMDISEQVPISGNLMQVLNVIWAAGIIVMLGYLSVTSLKLRRTVMTATRYERNVRQSEFITSPFVLGLIRPVIYIPSKIGAKDIKNIIAHEKAHIDRKDNWWKIIGYIILSVFWINPVVWVAYILFCKDMESACDEKVIRDMDVDALRDYSRTILNCSISHRQNMVYLPYFGSQNVKQRVKKVMNYRKPSFWMMTVSVFAVVCLSILLLLGSGKAERPDNRRSLENISVSTVAGEGNDADSCGEEDIYLIDGKLMIMNEDGVFSKYKTKYSLEEMKAMAGIS